MAYLYSVIYTDGFPILPATVLKPTTAGLGYQIIERLIERAIIVINADANEITAIDSDTNNILISNDVPFPYRASDDTLIPVTAWTGDVTFAGGRWSISSAGDLFDHYGYFDGLPSDNFFVEARLNGGANQETGIGFWVDDDHWIAVVIHDQTDVRIYHSLDGVVLPYGITPITYQADAPLNIRKTGTIWRVSYNGEDILLAALNNINTTRLAIISTGTNDSFLSVAWRQI